MKVIRQLPKQVNYHAVSKAWAAKNEYYTLWTPAKIKLFFKNGHGTDADLKSYIEDNKQFCYFDTIEI